MDVMDIAHDAIILVDQGHRITSFNRGAETIFGYAAGDVIGHPLEILIPESFRAVHGRHVAAFQESTDASRPMSQRGEISGLRKDGEIVPVEATISKLGDGDNPVYAVILRDITERKRAEDALRKSEARFEDYACAASDFFWETDATQRFSFVSSRFTAITGIPVESLLGKTREEAGFGQSTAPEIWRCHRADTVARRPFRNVEQPCRRPDGGTVYLSFSGKPLFDDAGVFQGYRGTGTDETARVTAENKARAAQD